MNICENCNKNCKKSIYSIHNNYINNIHLILFKHNINSDIVDNIITYILHTNGHIIENQNKSGIRPPFLEFCETSERSGYYWYTYSLFCSFCFQMTLIKKFHYNIFGKVGVLPFLRRDIYEFGNYKYNHIKWLLNKKNKTELNKLLLWGFLPNKYKCLFYRHKKPLIKNKFIYIFSYKIDQNNTDWN